jgi:hypothetical protein
VASKPERIPDTMLECFKSVVVAAIAPMSSRPKVNQSKAALTGSVVFVDIVVVGIGSGLVESVLDVKVAPLPLGLVEFDGEVSQSSAALTGFETLVDGTTLRVMDDGGVADAVLLPNRSWVARNSGVDSDMNISSSRSSTTTQASGRESADA